LQNVFKKLPGAPTFIKKTQFSVNEAIPKKGLGNITKKKKHRGKKGI
jgi:hypothetical protein